MNNQHNEAQPVITFREFMPIAQWCARLEEALDGVMNTDMGKPDLPRTLATLYSVMDERPSIGNSHE